MKSLVADRADDLLKADLETFRSFESYVDALFKREDEAAIYPKARMYELGMGEIENLPEAYRLYLIAASKGSKRAVKKKEQLRKELTAEERSKASCLAEKGLEPNWIQRQFC